MLGFYTNKKIIGKLYDALFREVKKDPVSGLFVELDLHDMRNENSKILTKFLSKLLEYEVLIEQIVSTMPNIIVQETEEIFEARHPREKLTYFKLSQIWEQTDSKNLRVKFAEWFIFKEKEKMAGLLHGKIWESLPATIGAIAAAISGAGFVLIGTWLVLPGYLMMKIHTPFRNCQLSNTWTGFQLR